MPSSRPPRPGRAGPDSRVRPTLAVGATAAALALVLSASGTPSAMGSSATRETARPSSTKATAAASRLTAPVLLPNMRTVQPSELRIDMINGVRWVRFTSQLANAGKGPVEVRPNDAGNCPRGKRHASQILYRDVNRNGHFDRQADTRIARRSAGCMIFHPSHHHWHFESAARYTLWNPSTAEPIASRPKTSFCLRDILRVPAFWHVAKRYPQYYGDCDRDTPQGISIGWSDRYSYYLPGQGVPLPPRLRNGVYCLRVTVDPQNQLHETDETDNRTVRSFTLSGRTISAGPPRPCQLPEEE